MECRSNSGVLLRKGGMASAVSAQSLHTVSQEDLADKREQPSLQAPGFPWHALPSSSRPHCYTVGEAQGGAGRKVVCLATCLPVGLSFNQVMESVSHFMWPIGILDTYVCVKGGLER